MLRAQVSVSDNTSPVDDKEPWALSQRECLTLHTVLPIHPPLRVGQAREGDIFALKIPAGVLQRIFRQADNLRPATLELAVVISQLREVPSAKRSTKAPQESKRHVTATEMGKPYCLAAHRGKGEIRGR